MTRCDPADQAGWPDKTRLQPVDFFLLKRRRFEFFFKWELTWWRGQNPEPEIWTGPFLKLWVYGLSSYISGVTIESRLNIK
jgi:hypothetical protein